MFQGLLLRTILFKLFINNLGKQTDKLDDIKLDSDMLEGKVFIQRHFNNLEKWACRNFPKLSLSGMS